MWNYYIFPWFVVLFYSSHDVYGTEQCDIHNQSTSYIADCQNCKLILVPTKLPNSITHLLLNNNHIRYVAAATFVGTPYLVHLDLSNNQISKLDKESFLGLSNLTYLNLDYNKLCMNYDSYPQGLFKYTPLLKVLKLYGKKECREEYPEGAVQHLNHLEELTLPFAKEPTFGKGFRNLRNLKKLIFSKESCFAGHHLNGTIFQNFVGLPIEELVMIKCHMKKIDPTTFSSFRHLKILNLACNYNIESISEVLMAVNNIPSKLDTLVLDAMHAGTFADFTPDSFYGESLRKLRRFSFRTKPGIPDMTAMQHWKLLQHITFGFNTNILKKYSYTNLKKMAAEILYYRNIHVKIIDLSYMGHVVGRKFQKNFCDHPTLFSTTEEFFQRPHAYKMNYPAALMNKSLSLYQDMPTQILHFVPEAAVAFYFDARILHVNILVEHLTTWSIHRLNMSHIKCPCLCMDLSQISGLHNLNILNVSHCNIETIDMKADLSGLLELYLNHNQLGFTTKPLKFLFDQSPMLEILDLSHNELKDIPSAMFSGLSRIKHIILNHNWIKQTNWIINSLKSLHMLDLSYNQVEYLEDTLMKTLSSVDQIAINLDGNPFICECTSQSPVSESEIIPFLEWIQSTPILTNQLHYMCAASTMPLLQMNVVDVIDSCSSPYTDLLKMQADHNRLLVICLGGTVSLTLVIAVIIVLAIHTRWRLRWMIYQLQYNGWHHVLFGHKNNDTKDTVYGTYIFFSDSNEDCLHWVVHKLLPQCNRWNCLHSFEGRDFGGDNQVPTADAIIKSIDTNDKSLFILDESFINDEWCLFALQMSIVKGLDHIIICQIGDFDVNTAPKFLTGLLDSVPYLRYMDKNHSRFWDKLEAFCSSKG